MLKTPTAVWRLLSAEEVRDEEWQTARSRVVRIPDGVFNELAMLARIPNDQQVRAQFRLRVCQAIAMEWRIVETQNSPMDTPTPDLKRALKRISRSADDLRDALTTSLGCANEWLAIGFIENDDNVPLLAFCNASGGGTIRKANPKDFATFVDTYAKAANTSLFYAQRWAIKAAKDRGRPKRPNDKNNSFHFFVYRLLLDTAETGGKLAFWKGECPLWKALRVLSAYLPDGFVPKVAPLSRLARFIRRQSPSIKMARAQSPFAPSNVLKKSKIAAQR